MEDTKIEDSVWPEAVFLTLCLITLALAGWFL